MKTANRLASVRKSLRTSAILAAAAMAGSGSLALADGSFTMAIGGSNQTWETFAWVKAGDTGAQVFPGDALGDSTETAILNWNNNSDRTVTISAAAGWDYDMASVTINQTISTSNSRTLSLNGTNAGTLRTNLIDINQFDGTSNGNRLAVTLNNNIALASLNAGADAMTIDHGVTLNTRNLTINGSIASTGLTLNGGGPMILNGAVNAGSGALNLFSTGSATFGSTVAAASVNNTANVIRTFSGGVTAGSFSSSAGTINLNAASAITTLNGNGGTINLAAANTITTVNANAGTVNLNNAGAAAGATINVASGATVAAAGSTLAGFTFGTTFNAASGAIVGHNDNTGTVAGVIPAGVLYGMGADIANVTMSIGGVGEYSGLYAIGNANRRFGTTTGGEVLTLNGSVTIGDAGHTNPRQVTIDAQIVGGAATTFNVNGLTNVRNATNTWSPLVKINTGGEFVVNIDLDVPTPGQQDGMGGVTNIELAGGKLQTWNGAVVGALTDGVLSQAITVTGNSRASHNQLNTITYAGGISGASDIQFEGADVASAPGRHVLSTANIGFTGKTTVASSTLELAHANALQNTTAIDLTGGNLLLDPTIVYSHSTAIQNLRGGSVGWKGNKVVASIAQVGTFLAADDVGGNTFTLGLGAAGDSGTVTLGFALGDVDPAADTTLNPVKLLKRGVGSTLDLSGSTNTHSGGTEVAGGAVIVDNQNNLGSGPLSVGPTGVLQANVDVTISTPLVTTGGLFLSAPGPAFNVAAGKTLAMTGGINNVSPNNRSFIVKTGDGVLDLDRATAPVYATSTTQIDGPTRFSLRAEQGTLKINYLPGSNATNRGGDSGAMVFAGGILDMTSPLPAGMPTITNTTIHIGFLGISSIAGTTSTIKLGAGQWFKNGDQANDAFHAWQGTVILEGVDETANYHLRGSSSGSSVGFAGTNDTNGVFDVRGGNVSFSNWSGSRIGTPVDATFTYKFNGGLFSFDGANTLANNNASQGFSGAVAFSDAAGTTLPKLSTTSTLTLGGTGDTTWGNANSVSLEKLGAGGLTFNRSGGTVAVAAGAKLLISNGTVTAGGSVDPFSDGINHVAIENNSTNTLVVNTTGGVNVAGLSGSGTTTVTTALTADHIRQGTLNLTGTAVATVRTNGGDSGTSVVGNLSIAAGAKLDVKDNDLVVTGMSAAAVRSLLVTGFNSGDWAGNGLTSSAAQNDPTFYTALGYADNAELGYATFSGQSVSGTDILVKYTFYGDTDLNGVVDSDDLTNWIDGFNGVGSQVWLYGDFDYSGVVDSDDLTLWVDGFLNTVGPLSASLQAEFSAALASGLASGDFSALQAVASSIVPEPASLSLLALGALALRRRRAGK